MREHKMYGWAFVTGVYTVPSSDWKGFENIDSHNRGIMCLIMFEYWLLLEKEHLKYIVALPMSTKVWLHFEWEITVSAAELIIGKIEFV